MQGNTILIFVAVMAVWFSVNRWILPHFGVETCMSGSCVPAAMSPNEREASETAMTTSKNIQEEPIMIDLNDANFDAQVLQSDQPVLVDFWAPWCGPCRMIGPVVDELAEENADKVRVGKVNVDENPATAAAYGIDSIPTLMIFKNGQPVDRIAGVQSKGRMQEAIDRASR